jgi:hypothetical protein
VPIVSLAAPAATPQIDFSDHRSFWEAGYPAIMVTDTATSRNPHYHRATDLPSTLDYRRMAEVVRMVHAGLMRMATASPGASRVPSREPSAHSR